MELAILSALIVLILLVGFGVGVLWNININLGTIIGLLRK